MGGVGSGRKAKSLTASKTQSNMAEAGLYGSQILRDYLRGRDTKNRKVPPISMVKLKASVDCVAHAIGLPKAKIELKTDAMTMKDIAELAASFDNIADKVAERLDKNAENFDENDVLLVPTKPLTARQIKERSGEKGADNAKN